MGAYVTFIAKPGCENQINEAYARWIGEPDEWLVYSPAIIEQEIKFIHSAAGEGQAHLRPHLNTPADWDRIFPVCRTRTGQLKVSGIEEDEVERIDQVKRDIAFVLEHRMLFERIDGLDDARIRGYTDYPLDLIEKHRGKRRPDESLRFNDLPSSRTRLYRRCVEHGRPDLWAAYLGFRDSPSWLTWCGLRDKVVPWSERGWKTVWQLAEGLAERSDGVNPGLHGRFRDGFYPSLDFVRLALH